MFLFYWLFNLSVESSRLRISYLIYANFPVNFLFCTSTLYSFFVHSLYSFLICDYFFEIIDKMLMFSCDHEPEKKSNLATQMIN